MVGVGRWEPRFLYVDATRIRDIRLRLVRFFVVVGAARSLCRRHENCDIRLRIVGIFEVEMKWPCFFVAEKGCLAEPGR